MTRKRGALLVGATLLFVAWPRRPRVRAQRILRISRVVADLDRAEAFYRDALGFRPVMRGPTNPAVLAVLGMPGVEAEESVMQLGEQTIALVRFATPGRGYPPDSRSDDLWFQHLAIVVSDMDEAYARLTRYPGWESISEGGPQTLPAANGGVRAFKFRDPDRHPLELIWFPPHQGRAAWHHGTTGSLPFLGIDHSALVIASVARCLRFYRALGFKVGDRSLNRGAAQSLLDGLSDARVRVTGLRPSAAAGPGLELLAYQPLGRANHMSATNDIATDWVTIAVDHLADGLPRLVRDPDGHRLVLVDQGVGSIGAPA